MSSRTHTINIHAVDRSTTTMMSMIRIMRAVGQEIRVLNLLMTALAAAEDAATFGAGSLSKILRLLLLGAAGAMAISTSVSLGQQGVVNPVTPIGGQTLPGQFRNVLATRPVLVHEGEVLSRPKAGEGMGGSATLTQTIIIQGAGDPEVIAEAIARQTRDKLRGMTSWMPR